MSVVKRKRNKSTFEVFHHLTKMRKDITDLLLRDFGYDFDKFRKQLEILLSKYYPQSIATKNGL